MTNKKIMTDVHHHLHKRKRKIIKTRETKFIKDLDKVIYIVGVIVPGLTFIQAYKIWVLGNADGISLITYAGFMITNAIWFLYGLAHNEKPIILMYSLLFIFNTLIAIGALVF